MRTRAVIVLSAAFFCTSCSIEPVSEADIEISQKFCRSHDGLEQIKPTYTASLQDIFKGIGDDNEAVCKDGVKKTLRDIEALYKK
jgi:hypothetical protein